MDTHTSQPVDVQVGVQACIACGNSERSLHRGETITTRVGFGVVRDIQALRCTACLLASREVRYEVAQLPDLIDGRRWWGILDHHTGSWLVSNGKIERYPWRDRAQSGIRRQRFLDDLIPNGGLR